MDDEDDKHEVAIQTLSDAQLIQVLQLADDNEELICVIEAEIARRKTDGRIQ